MANQYTKQMLFKVLLAFVQLSRENYSSLCTASRRPSALKNILRFSASSLFIRRDQIFIVKELSSSESDSSLRDAILDS